jgi:hypothetical protein
VLTGLIKEHLENIIHEVAMERHWTNYPEVHREPDQEVTPCS